LKLYWSVVRPVVNYACETWVLKESKINKLLVFDGKILFGPSKENYSWRMKTNRELNHLINHKNTFYTCTKTLMAWPRRTNVT
jgi:hypothetical protein